MTPSVRLGPWLIKSADLGGLAHRKERGSPQNSVVQPLSVVRLFPVIGADPLDEQEAAICCGPVGDQVLSPRRNLVGASDAHHPHFLLRFARGDGQSTFKNKIVIGGLSMEVPGNGFSRRECENPRLDVASDCNRLDVLHLVIRRLGSMRRGSIHGNAYLLSFRPAAGAEP